jgi:hypothetical protein
MPPAGRRPALLLIAEILLLFADLACLLLFAVLRIDLFCCLTVLRALLILRVCSLTCLFADRIFAVCQLRAP